ADYCDRSGLDYDVAEDMLSRQRAQHLISPFTSFFVQPEGKPSAADLAEHYLLSRGLEDMNYQRLRYYKAEFYRYKNNQYIRHSTTDLKADINKHLQAAGWGKYAGHTTPNNMIAAISGRTLVEEAVQAPCLLTEPDVI